MFIKYPKTKHIEKHWADASLMLYDQIMVVEEKMDGKQVGISFDSARNGGRTARTDEASRNFFDKLIFRSS